MAILHISSPENPDCRDIFIEKVWIFSACADFFSGNPSENKDFIEKRLEIQGSILLKKKKKKEIQPPLSVRTNCPLLLFLIWQSQIQNIPILYYFN